MFKKINRIFKLSKESSKLPFITPLLFTFGFSSLISKNNNFISKIFDATKYLFTFDNIPVIPATDKKQTLIFDVQNLCIFSKFSFSHLDFIFYKRDFCEEFLFYLYPKYELINITDRQPSTSLDIISKIDLFGCISYRLFVNNKKDIMKKHLNRDLSKCIILSTSENEYNENLMNNNTFLLKKWNGRPDSGLFDLYLFLNNISDHGDFRPLIKSYKNIDFESKSKEAQKKFFLQQNLFSFKNFQNELKKEEARKIKEYKDINLKVNKKTNYKSEIFHFIKNIM